MHTPNPGSDPRTDDEGNDDVRQPPVPPDRQDEIVPVEEPPKPGSGKDRPPMIVATRRADEVSVLAIPAEQC